MEVQSYSTVSILMERVSRLMSSIFANEALVRSIIFSLIKGFLSWIYIFTLLQVQSKQA